MSRRFPLLASMIALAFAVQASAATPAPSPRRAAVASHGHKEKPAKPKLATSDPLADLRLDIAGFGVVSIYKPEGAAKGLALFASGDSGWNRGVVDMAHEAAQLGFLVAGFSTPQFLKALDGGAGACSDADGLLATLGDRLVQRLGLPLDTRPVLIGYSSGATVVYAALAADAGQRIAGGISLGFCPDLNIRKPFCPGRGGLTQHKQETPPFGAIFDKHDTVRAPWRILQGEIDQVCDPKFAPEFAAGQSDTQAILLPKVGHGFGVPRNWKPEYRKSLEDLLK